MSEFQSNNKSNLSNIPGGFAVIPNALLGFLSDRACVVFLKIYQCQFQLENVELDGEAWIKLSTYYLAQSLNKDHKTISIILDELLGLNIVLRHHQNRKSVFYKINWNEVMYVCESLCRVDVKGRIKLMEKCVQGNFTPMSQLPNDFIKETIQKHPFVQRLRENFPKTNLIQGNFPSINSGSGNISLNEEALCDAQSDNYLNADTHDNGLGKFSLKKDIIQGKFPSINRDSGKFSPQIYNKEINKEKQGGEAPNIKEEKDKNLLEYFSSRSFSFPAFDKTLLESFLNEDLNEDDDDVIKSIKQVWNQLEYDEELPENNYIDLGSFQNILFHSWQQLKQDYPDYSLAENDMKNIFGFLVIEHEGENCLYIDPSKLQDISASEQKEPEPSVKETKYSDRASRRLFIDCINEIAGKDDRLLTSSEFVALLLMDYAEDYSTGSYAVEITKMAYKNLISQFAEQSGVPAEDIQMLFKELPQKGKVKISPQQLSPDKFFQYNAGHQQESEVEKLFKTKLAEQTEI